MTEKKSVSPIRHAIMVGALAAGGCSPAVQQPSAPEVEEALPEMQTLPPLPPVYSELGEDRLTVELVLGEKYLPLDVSPGQDPQVLSANLDREIREALRHPERYENVALRVRDIAGELPPCLRSLAIPTHMRTRDGLSSALNHMLRDETTVSAVLGCDDGLRARFDWFPPEPAPRETIDPRSIVRRDDGRGLAQSTRLQENPLHRA